MNWLGGFLQKLLDSFHASQEKPFMMVASLPIARTGYKKMNNLGNLCDAINEAFMMGLPGEKWEPKDGVTHCNEAINYVCEKLTYIKFRTLMANQIYDLLQNNGDWLDVTPEASQYHANAGALVIAGWKNPVGHGHVAIVCPGTAELSPSWNYMAPKLMNIGETNFIGKRASFAFSAERRPKFFALKTMI